MWGLKVDLDLCSLFVGICALWFSLFGDCF